MTKGVVKTWMGRHGFAEAASGEVVWIHHREIPDDKRLKVGATITFDMEKVEGHGGRVKGVNVSGAGVVPKTEAPTKEERDAERADWEQFKKDKIAVDGAPPPKKEKKEKAKKEKKEKAKPAAGVGRGGGAMGIAGAGGRGGRGGGMVAYGSAFGGRGGRGYGALPVAEELRIDPADGNAYTKEQFLACYGGLKQWKAASSRAPQVPAPGRGRGVVERRVDPADGMCYTKEEFKACYGGYKQWDRAMPYMGVSRGRGQW